MKREFALHRFEWTFIEDGEPWAHLCQVCGYVNGVEYRPAPAPTDVASLIPAPRTRSNASMNSEIYG